LWGVTNAFAKAVNKRLKIIRKKNWVEKINLKILIINNKNDRVVESKKIKKINQRLNNSEIIEFVDTEHEIFMEKDEYRDILWKKLDNFLS
jgi:alpha-beta hydrolase superfamily lysophospholipase